jgi:solute:Na+ symporter, SSS family
MSIPDWIVLVATLLSIIVYGIYRSRTTRDLDGYFLSNREMPWYLVLLSIMGTQASAITFLSAPGQAYTDGMRFVQYYFGLPLAMVILCITFLPMFHKLKIYTAYEFLEKRFDLKTRTFTSFLFLLSRGLSTGISVYAPSIILSSILGWNIYITNIIMGGLLIIYTVSGGAKAVAYTQQLQLGIVFTGMFLAGYTVVKLLPEGIGFSEALSISGKMGRLNVITTGQTPQGFDWTDRYNIFSGVIGGFFLALSYFGTDQSQVGRYLTAKSIRESRMGLLMNGLVKVPMQFFILLIGAMVFVFYQFNPSPLFFNKVPIEEIRQTSFRDSLSAIEKEHAVIVEKKKQAVAKFPILVSAHADAEKEKVITEMRGLQKEEEQLRSQVKRIIKSSNVKGEANDTNYIFLRFVMDYLPAGLVGLLIAVIFLAAWGSIAAALNSLASATMVDFHKKFFSKSQSDEQEYRTSRLYTLGWGIFCIVVAELVTGMGSLIEAVNVLGSWFYGVILGIFLVAFYLKKIGGNAVFWAALSGEVLVITMYVQTDLAWLWLNAIGAIAVIIFAVLLQGIVFRKVSTKA